MEKEKKSEKVNVRVIKRTARKKPVFQKLEPSVKTKKPSSHPAEQKKKIKVIAAVVVVMLIVFITWLSFLDNNLSRVDNGDQSFWGRIISNIKNEFNGIKDTFDEAKSSLSGESETLLDTELESDVFPETK